MERMDAEAYLINELQKMPRGEQQAAIWLILNFRDMLLFLSSNATSTHLERISKRLRKEKACIPAALVDLKITLLKHHTVDFPLDGEE